MQKLFFLFFLIFLHQGDGLKFKDLYKDTGKLLKASADGDVGEPLILTPFLQNGSISEAQQAALVKNDKFQNVESYAGYFTVDDRFNSNLWFWYIPSADNVAEDPVVLWLNGGPGATSLNGLFDENGPFIVEEGGNVSLREWSWHRNHSIIFVDNPVGVGFSFTDGGLAENETKVGEDMYSALTQFFQLFPDLQTNAFFLSGESYAGKYLPAIGYTILKSSPNATTPINLQGILIGDGWTDPINQLNYGPFVYNTGLVSAAVKKDIDRHRKNALKLYKEGDFEGAAVQSDTIVGIIKSEANVNVYNYLVKMYSSTAWTEFINTDEIRRALHVGNITFGDKGAGDALRPDEMRSVAPWVEELLENYRMLFYVGQLDIICGYPMVVDFLQTLNFTGVEEYRNFSRYADYSDDKYTEPAGYVRMGGNLVEYMIRGAGHMVPRDQPEWAHYLLYTFTRNDF